jgi:hypothetical protein
LLRNPLPHPVGQFDGTAARSTMNGYRLALHTSLPLFFPVMLCLAQRL